MTGQAYRLGQVAKMIGCSTYKLRRLCEAGLIDAELTGKGQWRVPGEECDRLEREGLPPMPTSAGDPDENPPTVPPARRANRTVDVGAPDTVSEEVQEERDHVDIAEARLKRRRLELAHEEVEDAFRDRERRRQEPLLAAQRRREEAERVAHVRDWRDKWLTYASNLIPADCAPALRIQVHKAAEHTLDDLGPEESDQLVTKLVKATVDAGLHAYHRQKAIEKAISAALDTLPHGARWDESWKVKATGMARKRIATLESAAAEWELVAAAKQAVVPICVEFEEQKTRADLLKEMMYWRWDATADDRERAGEALREALDDAPAGTSPAELRRLRDRVIDQYDRRIDVRKQQRAERLEAEQHAQAALHHVARYLSGNYEFDSFSDRLETEHYLKEHLLPALTKRFLDGRLEDQDDAQAFIEDTIDERLDDED